MLLNHYLRNGESSYDAMCVRVAHALASSAKQQAALLSALVNQEVIPSSLILYSAGDTRPCFCSDIALPWDAHTPRLIQQSLAHGLGVSVHIPNNALVMQTLAETLRDFQNVKQRGLRYGATMITCSDTHPQLKEFIALKNTHRDITHCNFSVVLTTNAKQVIEKIAPAAHACGDPGIIFPSMCSRRVAPCAQYALKEWQSVAMVHVNLANLVENGVFDTKRFSEVLRVAHQAAESARKKHAYVNAANKAASTQVLIGALGYAEALEKVGIHYDESHDFARTLGSVMQSFPCALAPNGATSRLLGVTPNIEPKQVVSWKVQIDIAAVFQEHLSGAISKTIVLEKDVSMQEVEDVFLYAQQKKLKGITVYRKNSL